MGLLSRILLAPVRAPFDATLWVSDKIREAAENEMQDPAVIKRTLRALEIDLEAGLISEDEYEKVEVVRLERLKAGKSSGR